MSNIVMIFDAVQGCEVQACDVDHPVEYIPNRIVDACESALVKLECPREGSRIACESSFLSHEPEEGALARNQITSPIFAIVVCVYSG